MSKLYLIRFPAQETISGASKIPTIIYYDLQGDVQAVGAEATGDGILLLAEEGGWVKAEWYVNREIDIRSSPDLARLAGSSYIFDLSLEVGST